MQLGFVIDHESCIGCHACTVACKAENDVPVGNFRTNVKYVEEGQYPTVKRHFLVQRCNHCSDAPCVTICPVNALTKRDDGIVDVDRDACIGCRACMQACPYDALYLNDDSGAVEKCHFCAHRVEVGLEPACVNVCPVNAIIAGDLDDPASRASQMKRENETKVRREEQKTGPNVHYIGADDLALEPGRAARPEMFASSDRPPDKPEAWPSSVPTEAHARVALDDGHRVEWRWPVAAYLVTKGIAAGVAMLLPFMPIAVAGAADGMIATWWPEAIVLFFLAVTCGLLVEDLARPWLFYRLLTRPNWKSWLVRGGIVLAVAGVVELGVLIAIIAGVDGVVGSGRWIGAILGIGVAGYTAMLFAQCKGRDLWESRWLLPHLLVQAVMCGAAVLAIAPGSGGKLVHLTLEVTLGLHLLFALVERYGPHATANARQGAGFLGVVRLGGVPAFAGGLVLTVVIGFIAAHTVPALAFIPVLAGLYLYEHAFVRAGQLPPLS